MVSIPQDDIVSDPGSAIIGKIGVGVLKAVAPGAFAWIKTQVVGKTVLFVGPARVGKTSFINYLRAGHYVDLDDYVPRTQEVSNVGSLQMKSSNGIVSIDVKKIIDTRGQDFADEHAHLVSESKPHAICLILDASGDWGAGEDSSRNQKLWLDEFADGLCEQRESNPAMFNRLKSFSILLNKVDAISAGEFAKREIAVKNTLIKKLTGANAKVAKKINIKPLSLIEEYEQGKLPVKAALTLFTPFVRD